jgi:tryptophanyl-tRNA synthetase
LISLQEYRAGTLLTGQLKGKCIALLQQFVLGFQEVRAASILSYTHELAYNHSLQRRKAVTDEQVREFMDASRTIEPTMAKALTTDATSAAPAAS